MHGKRSQETSQTAAMKAAAMKLFKENQEPAARKSSGPIDATRNCANGETDEVETRSDADENDLDESDLLDADDDRWDVFILDDDGDPLPDYGDFWFPD